MIAGVSYYVAPTTPHQLGQVVVPSTTGHYQLGQMVASTGHYQLGQLVVSLCSAMGGTSSATWGGGCYSFVI